MTRTFVSKLAAAFLLASAAAQEAPHLHLDHVFKAKSNAAIRGGGMLAPGRLLTWGRDLLEWDLETGKPRTLAKGPFEAGCAIPGGVAVQQTGGILTRRRPPAWTPEFIDNNVFLSDCLWTTLLGHPGLLMIHRNTQVRHYEPPSDSSKSIPKSRWDYQEIYSIYTASKQTGLAIEDIDRDGRPDIYCGNYWIQSPHSYGLPWRLFAIQPHYTEPDASTVSLLPIWGGLVAGQRDRSEPMFSFYSRRQDVRQLWRETPLPAGVRNPRAFLEWNGGLLVGENVREKPSRLLWIAKPGKSWIEITPSAGIVGLFEDQGRIVALEDSRVLVLSGSLRRSVPPNGW